MYALTALGVTVGFHRLLTHRGVPGRAPGCATRWPSSGSIVGAGPRDRLGGRPPQAPYVHRRRGRPAQPPRRATAQVSGGMVNGLWHAHVGWLFETHGQASSKRFARDPAGRPERCDASTKGFPLIALYSLAPALPSWLRAQRRIARRRRSQRAAVGAWPGADLPRPSHHLEHQLDSATFFGSRRFQTDDESTNVFWAGAALARRGPGITTTTRFPQSALPTVCAGTSSIRSGWLILGLERIGLASDVIKVTPGAMRARSSPQTGEVERLTASRSG